MKDFTKILKTTISTNVNPSFALQEKSFSFGCILTQVSSPETKILTSDISISKS